MAAIIFVSLIVLGCLFISTCITVLTFTVVDMRRTGVAMAFRLEDLGQRNYDVMSDTNKIAKRLEDKMDTLLNRVVPMEPEE